MASIFGLLGIARDGIAVQSAALHVTGQNITNANTPGYVRRSAQIETWGAGRDTAGSSIFAGVHRNFDEFARARVWSDAGDLGAATARQSALSQVESRLAPSSGGISERFGALLASFTTLAENSQDTTARTTVLTRAQEFAASLSDAAGQVESGRAILLSKAQNTAQEVGDRLDKIAALNRRIATSGENGEGSAALRDERDVLVREVAERVGAHAIEAANGTVSLHVNGITLLDGEMVSRIEVTGSPGVNASVTITRPGGNTIDATNRFTGGILGGLLEARDQDLTAISAELDQFAFDAGTRINTLHAAGFGLDGVSGRPLFSFSGSPAGAAQSMALDPGMIGRPERLAASSTATGVPARSDNAVLLSQVANTPLPSGATLTERLSSFFGNLGSKTAGAERERALREEAQHQSETLLSSATGVSLDEEMVNLTQFQRAFEASTRVLQAADELLKTLIQEIR